MKSVVVIKEDPGCTILTNPDPSRYLGLIHVANPDLSGLRGVPPELWDIIDGEVVSTVSTRVPPVSYKNEDEIRNSIKKVAADLEESTNDAAVCSKAIKADVVKISKQVKLLAAALLLIVLISAVISMRHYVTL